MKRTDRIKLSFLRNWQLPGRERLSRWLKTSAATQTALIDGITWLNQEDLAVYTTSDNYIEHMVLVSGVYETEIRTLINLSLKPGFTALDIGANIGIQSIRMANRVGTGGKVYAFEPLGYLQEKFKKNLALNHCTNVSLFPIALSDKEETRSIRINEHNWNQGTFSLNDTGTGQTQQELTVRIGDQVAEIAGLERLDLIKVDVEGFEYHVLRGLKNTIMRHRPRIIFEYDAAYWTRTGQSITDCLAMLHHCGYRTYQIYAAGCELIRDPALIASENLLAIPE
ncbi:FkbM family methyltransferase [Mucilaginibacter angelicae]|uniref:FkbM family methyltransferase n=1 Tax=Mucilaginibacter angelicae TaxID=869718 RepID=A0ABV6L555_9SPHI